MAGWHHQLDGCEFEWTPGDGDGQGGLVCCNSWGRKESDTTEQLNWTGLNWIVLNKPAKPKNQVSKTMTHFLKDFFFECGPLLVFIKFVTVMLLFYILVFWLWGMWNLNSLTGDQTFTPCIEKQSLNHWTTKEVPFVVVVVVQSLSCVRFFCDPMLRSWTPYCRT